MPALPIRPFHVVALLAGVAGMVCSRAHGADVYPVEPAPRVTYERALLAPGTAPALDRQGRELYELAGVSVRWWSRHGRSDVGIGVGTLGFVPRPEPGAGNTLLGPMPSVTLGWRYRVSGDTALYADATGVRALAGDGPMPGIVSTKLGVEWKPASSRFGFENRALGIQLQSGYRMSLRVRGGGLGVYLRGQF